METPSSTRRVTRSQTSTLSQNCKQEDGLSRSRTGSNTDRWALLDITNDSPIVGVAAGGLSEKTPLSLRAKSSVSAKRTPCSGEALLRGQVKILLQKVEEESQSSVEASLVNKLPHIRLQVLGFERSPAQLLAPTPANTPQTESLPACQEERANPTNPLQVVVQMKKEDLSPCLLNRALLFDDSPSKSETSDSSLTVSSEESGGSSYKARSSDEENSSVWSLQVNTSIQEDDEELEYFKDVADDDTYCNEEGFDELCGFMENLTVEDKAKLPEFEGKHTRFLYNSEDEIEGEVEVGEVKKAVSPGATVLKGFPVPEGKHIRFQEDED